MTDVRTEDAHLELHGGRTYLRRWQPAIVEGATPILLLHDSLGSVEQWHGFPAQLAQRLRRPVIAYDRPGFGRSSPPGRRCISAPARMR